MQLFSNPAFPLMIRKRGTKIKSKKKRRRKPRSAIKPKARALPFKAPNKQNLTPRQFQLHHRGPTKVPSLAEIKHKKKKTTTGAPIKNRIPAPCITKPRPRFSASIMNSRARPRSKYPRGFDYPGLNFSAPCALCPVNAPGPCRVFSQRRGGGRLRGQSQRR